MPENCYIIYKGTNIDSASENGNEYHYSKASTVQLKKKKGTDGVET